MRHDLLKGAGHRYTQVAAVLTVCYALSQATLCPSKCSCRSAVIDCANRRLSAVPYIQPQSSSMRVLNFSVNSLTALDNLQNLPPSQTSLDLSHNQLSSIPLNTFSGEQFLELRALNLTANLLTDVGFVYPLSLEVLRLSSNRIEQFCLDRIKDLTRLRSLYLEDNGLKTLLCQAGKLPAKSSGSDEYCPFLPFRRISEVFLQKNKLTNLEQGPMQCFQNAQFLSVADNSLKTLPARLFHTFHKLKYLDLSGNRLTYIQDGLFHQLPNLKFLSLARNRLVHLPTTLPMLEWLDVSNNAITTISVTQKSDLYPQEVFLIGGNPLLCDCQLLWLKELFDTREYLLKYVDVDRTKFIPVCAGPDHLRGESWDVLGDASFGCEGNEAEGAAVKESKILDGSKPSHQAPQKPAAVVQLEDLAFRVQDAGASYIRLQWDSLQLSSKKPAPSSGETGRKELSTGEAGEEEPVKDEGREEEPSSVAKNVEKEAPAARKVYINIHPFGQKKQKQSLAVHLAVGTHRIIGLKPSTAYVVCVSLIDPAHIHSHAGNRDDCVEVVTKDDEQFQLRDIYMRIGIVVLGFALLALKCCFTSGLHKDMASRRKND